MLKINKTAILLKKNSRWVSATGRLMIPMAIFAGLLFLLGPDVEISAPDAMRDIEGEQAPYASMTHTSDAEGNATRLDVPVRLRLTAAPGDTLMAMLVDEGIERREAHAAIIAMSKIFKPQNSFKKTCFRSFPTEKTLKSLLGWRLLRSFMLLCKLTKAAIKLVLLS